MDMLIPVMIVDDEYLIRSLIRNSIDWTGLGFTLVGEAEDGEIALDLAEKIRPRLMIVDINIPFINGLELSRLVRARHPEIKIIILTGYEDFQYALQAIKTGVLNYILKPLNPEEFRTTLLAAKAAILNEEKSNLVEMADAGAEGAVPVRERFLRLLLAEETAPAEAIVEDRFRLFRIDLEKKDLVVALFELRKMEGSSTRPADQRETAGLLAGFPASEAARFGRCELFQDGRSRVVLLMNEDRSTSRLKDKAYASVGGLFLEHCAAFGGFAASGGVGRPAAALGGLPRSRREAEKALEESFYSGLGRLYFHGEAQEKTAPPAELFAAAERDKFLLLLRSGREGEAEAFLKTLLRKSAELRPPRHYCEMACLEIAAVIIEFIEENDFGPDDFLEGGDVYSRLRGLGTLKEMEDWLLELLREVRETVDRSLKTRTHQVARKAKAFIERNYARPYLTLERIAEPLSVTATYLSTIFKKDLGISVVAYLTEYRLARAKELMDEAPLLTVAEIAAKVGYSDPYYFSKCFRKHFGLAPSAYLRRKNPAGRSGDGGGE